MRSILFLFLSAIAVSAGAQVGGESIFRFLRLPNSARLTAIGGVNISSADADATLAAYNPASLSSSMHQSLSFNHQFYFAGLQNGYFNYAHHFARSGWTAHAGFQYLQYGEFKRTDEFDQELGTFRSGDYAALLGASKNLYERLRLGVNLKFINSSLDAYTASALAADLGASYEIEEQKLSIGLVIQNLGFALSSFREGDRESMPYDVQLGLSKRLNHAPFRFSVTAHHLHRWNLLYDNPESEEKSLFIGDAPPVENPFARFADNLFRHLVFGAELYVGKKENIRLRVGYNHFRRKELTVLNFRSLAGFSAGFGLHIKQFRVDYGFGTYHLAGSAHHLSISTNLQRFAKEGATLDL